jgi:hypothetical protein
MIKEEFIEVIGHSRNKDYYNRLGYEIEIRKTCLIRTKDLSKGSMSKVTTICEKCSKESKNIFKDYWNYTKGFTEKYYCNSCKSIKSEKTSLEKWGVKNPMQNDKVKDKLKKSLLDKYGVSCYSKTDEWLVKFKKTSLEKWGYDNPSKNPKVIDDIRDKNIEMLTSDSFRENSKIKKQRNTWKRYAERLSNEYSVVSYDTDIFKIKHKDCNSLFEITKGLLYTRLKNNSILCLGCNPIEIKRSSFEIEVGYFLESMNINIEVGNRNILNNLELDYYLPEHKLAIECNGLYWHNELFKSKKYHINKTKECEKLGIKLIHIWEDDWLYKKNIIKSIIKNKINIISNKIWARKCLIKSVETKEYKDFLNNNHIQGYSSSSHNIGLYYKGELVSLMTFGWRRTNNKREFELIRFCNKLDYIVIGAASKLFKYFLSNVDDIISVTSYSDISLFSGLLYERLGFRKVNLSEPNYFWVVNGIRRHRYNFSKRKLVRKGYDPKKTGLEIMNDLGHWRIFSTGQEKWIYKL